MTLKFQNFDQLVIGKEVEKNYKENLEQVGKISITLYNGNKWNTSNLPQIIKDGSKEKKFATFKTFILFWDQELNENFMINDYGKDEIKRYINEIINYAKYLNYAASIKNSIAKIKNILINNSILLSDSTLFLIIKAEGLKGKSNNFQNGFLTAFQNHNSINLNNNEEIDGFKFGLIKIGKRYDPKAYDELEQILEKYKKDYQAFNNKIKEVNNWKVNLEQKLNQASTKNSEKVNNSIEELQKQKRRLMLSGPLKMWYDRLSEYIGGVYYQKNDSDFKFINISKSTLKKYKYKTDEINKKFNINIEIIDSQKQNGKIKKSFNKLVCFGFLGLLFLGIAIAVPIVLFNNELWNVNKKLFIFVSLAGSFFLFIYGYILRVLVKNWISNRHISEEISERISLTQFYLTLIDEAKMSENQINFALAEIFKRINSGLIKEEEGKSDLLIELLNKMK